MSERAGEGMRYEIRSTMHGDEFAVGFADTYAQAQAIVAQWRNGAGRAPAWIIDRRHPHD